jgi:hypothetical protein
MIAPDCGWSAALLGYRNSGTSYFEESHARVGIFQSWQSTVWIELDV